MFSFFGDAIDAASDLAETTSKVNVVFEEQADSILKMGETSAEALGMSKDAALAAAGTYGNLFRAMGISTEASATMSTGLVQLAADLASFNNMDPTEVLDKLRSGLSGETEPLKTLGVNLSAARIEAEAMAMGFEKVNGALTPAAKAQATYALILKDTALAQGDFARTSDGLANQQRINAAKLEDAMARLGEALLPLAVGFAGLAGDVLPELIDAIEDVFKVVGPLGGLWVKHANVLIPALVAVISIKLIVALKGLATQAKLTGLSMKAMWASALLGLPFLIEGVDAVSDSLDGFFANLGKSESEQRAWHDLMDLVGQPVIANALRDMGVSAEQFARLMEAGAFDAAEAFTYLRDHAGQSIDELTGKLSLDWSSYVGPSDLRDALAGGADEVAVGAKEGITDPIAEAAKAAREAAILEAFKTPGEIAAALIEGRDLVLGAATGLADAATDPLVQAAKITEIREQMHDLANLTAEEIKDATPATIAADKLKYAQLEIQLAGYLLRADPKSKEAAQLLAKYAESEEPATKAAYDALMGAVEDRAYIMANDIEAEAERAGISPEEAFRRHQVAAAIEAGSLATRAVKSMQAGLIWDGAGAAGAAIGSAWVTGIGTGITNKMTNLLIATGKAKNLLGGSLPTEGPLQHPERGGWSIGETWVSKGIAPAIRAAMGDLKRALTLPEWAGGALPLMRAPATTAALPGQGSIGGMGSGDTYINNNYLDIQGEKPVVSTAAEIAEQAARLGRFRG